MKKKFQYVLFILVSLFAIGANAAPMAYSVNSDSGNLLTEDSLYLIDLATGSDQIRGELISGFENRLDTEGLAKRHTLRIPVGNMQGPGRTVRQAVATRCAALRVPEQSLANLPPPPTFRSQVF